MEKITVNTGLDHFLLIDCISEAGQNSIEGTVSLSGSQCYLLVEAAAQLGAMHVRYVTDFSCHAFLLGIRKCGIPEKNFRSSRLLLSGMLKSRSSSGFLYDLKAVSENKEIIAGEFMFATVPYDQKFKKESLESHYRKVFSCLKNGS